MEPDTTEPISDALADALASLTAAAVRVAAAGLAALPPPHRAQIKRAVDDETCALTVQVDLPDGAVRVMADGPGWVAPQTVFATEWNASADTPPRLAS